jgi:hypothetical protein
VPFNLPDLSQPILPDLQRLHRLSPRYRWEFQRRHPHYLRHWEAVNDYWGAALAAESSGKEAPPPSEAVLLIRQLGMTGWCPDPALTVEKLAGITGVNLDELDGAQAVWPATRRHLVQGLLAAAPDLRKQLGNLLVSDGDRNADLQLLNHPDLDEELCVVHYNPRTSVNTLVAQFREVVSRDKQRLQTPEVRERPDSLDGYLRAWDLREGWVGGRYDGAQARRLRDIALAENENPGTVRSRYYAAFRLLTGREYDPLIWAALFGQSKWAGWRRAKGPPTGGRRPKVLGQETFDPPSPDSDNQAYIDLMLDVRSLILKGKTDEEIVVQLELPKEAKEFIGQFRDHNAVDP